MLRFTAQPDCLRPHLGHLVGNPTGLGVADHVPLLLDLPPPASQRDVSGRQVRQTCQTQSGRSRSRRESEYITFFKTMYSASVECTGGISFFTLSSCLRIPITLTVVVYGWSLQSCRAAAALQDWGGVHPPHGPSQNVLPRPQLDPRHIRQRVDRRRRPGCDPVKREQRGVKRTIYLFNHSKSSKISI